METSTYMPSSWGILGVCGGWLQSCKSWRGSPRFLFAHFCVLRQTVVNINGFMDFKIILTKWTNGLNRGHRLSSLQFSCSVVSDSLRPHESQHARPPCPSPTPGVHSNSCAFSRWCHPAISSSVVPFSSCLQSSQHQDLFKWVSSSHQVAKVLEFQLQQRSFQWIFRTYFL